MNNIVNVWLNNIHFYSLRIAQMKNTQFKVNQFYNKNQFVFEWDWKTIFQSYDSTIAIIDYENKTLTIWIDWDYSKATSKHFYLFLSDYCFLHWFNKKAVLNLIKDWIFNYWYSEFKVIYDENLR